MKRLISALAALALLVMWLPARASAAEPDTDGKSAVLMDVQTGTVLYEKNAQEKLSMASTTKIMTTLLCIESGDLDEEFSV